MSTTSYEPADFSGVVDIPISDLRDRLGETFDRVDREDVFVYVTRHGRRIGAIMPADIAENYEYMEDAYWARRAADCRNEPARPLAEVIADLEGEA